MYLSELRLWNFRKYGNDSFDLEHPHLRVPFAKKINVLVGENDSGKTAIVDAIKLVLKTNALEYIHITDDDFYNGSKHLRIEMTLAEVSDDEATLFQDWDPDKRTIRLILDVTRENGRISPYEVCIGEADDGTGLDPKQKEALKITYLKPLRDAENELTARKNSRISQILLGHELFKQSSDAEHPFIGYFKNANESVEKWFNDAEGENSNKSQIKDVIDKFLQEFVNVDANSSFELAEPNIRNILEKISLKVRDAKNLGLGTLNRLYMAAELLHLNRKGNDLKLCVIEELEAHIHPQAQMKVMKGLSSESHEQFVLTTHSPNITSKLRMEDENNNLIICKGNKVFPMGDAYTMLDKKDYKYLDHFLDVTKSSLFFAKGVILVEGWAEEILIPVLAEKLGIDLTTHEVSIINVGSTAYLHFARVFMRQNEPNMDVKCAVVTDMDVQPDDDWNFNSTFENDKRAKINDEIGQHGNVKVFLAPHWTLEWCLFMSPSIKNILMEAVSEVHTGTEGFKRDENGNFNEESFRDKLSDNLKKRSLDKVAIASILAQKIQENDNFSIDDSDEYIRYLLDAIRFAANKYGGN